MDRATITGTMSCNDIPPRAARRWHVSPRTPFLVKLSAIALAQVAIHASRLAAILVLTRCLSPAEFGAAANILTADALSTLFTRTVITAKVVQAAGGGVEPVARTAH